MTLENKLILEIICETYLQNVNIVIIHHQFCDRILIFAFQDQNCT